MVHYPRWQALLKRCPNGEAAVVEVADELWVNGATELSHFSVRGSNENPLNCFHHDIVEQGVLCPRGKPITNTRLGDLI